MSFEILSVIFAGFFILFLPGFIVSFIFFDRGKIDLLERLALSFALSISLVPLIVFYANLLNVPINALSITIEVLLLIIIALGILFYQRKITIEKTKRLLPKK